MSRSPWPSSGRASSPGSAALARCYDLDMLDEQADVDLYLALASRTGSPVLELAAGSGRLAVPLAAAGHRVVGVDIDVHMLQRARDRWARERGRRAVRRLELIEADLLGLDIGRRFRLVMLALNGLLLLPGLEAQSRALEVMAAHLERGGLAVVDIALSDALDLAAYDGRLTLEWQRTDEEAGQLVTKFTSARYEAHSASVELTQIFDAADVGGGPLTRLARTDRLSLLSADQLVSMARAAGLEPVDLGEDHLLTPLGSGSTRVVLVARLV